jgi:hypothetical protein
MVGIAQSRRIERRRKRALWAATLCSASFVTGHVLFGEDQPAAAPAKPSLIQEYLEAKSDLVGALANIEPPATHQPKPVIIAAEPVTNDYTAAETASSGALRPAAVSTATSLPFITAQPLPTTSEVRSAPANTIPTVAPVIVQASAAVSAPKPALPTDDENLPPIVPAWAVPRPAKRKPVVVPVQVPAPARATEPTSATFPAIQNAPQPMRIELGGAATPSPATLPQSSPPGPAANKRAESSPLQRLPQVIEMTPRVSGFQPTTTARSTASKEPALLPPPPAAQPLPMEIRNPHVSRATPASFEMPLQWPSTTPQHVDDTNPLR